MFCSLSHSIHLSSWSFRKTAGVYLKLADNCFLLNDSACQEAGFIIVTFYLFQAVFKCAGISMENKADRSSYLIFLYCPSLPLSSLCLDRIKEGPSNVIFIKADGQDSNYLLPVIWESINPPIWQMIQWMSGRNDLTVCDATEGSEDSMCRAPGNRRLKVLSNHSNWLDN